MSKRSHKYTFFFLMILMVFLVNAQETRKINFAVLGLKNGTGVTSGETDILADRLRVNLFRTGKVVMMERSQMDEILKEQGFQASGACNDAECAVEMGQMLGVERVVGGSIGKLGNLFLVNLRVIDVQTAKILMVVSKDISGGIEGVVKVLQELADDLVKDPKGEGAPVKVKPVVEEQAPIETVADEKQENETSTTETGDSEFSADKSVKKSSTSGKNKNRGGVRLVFMLNPGDMDVEYYSPGDGNSDYYEVDWLDEEWATQQWGNYSFMEEIKFTERKFRAAIQFVIPFGRFVAADIGPGFRYYRRSVAYVNDFYDTSNFVNYTEEGDRDLQFFSPNVSLGLNFVKRFYPLKINAGFALDLNFNIIRYKFVYDISPYSFSISDIDVKEMAFDFNASFGPRVGVEILGGENFGFSIDYMLKFDKIETDRLEIDHVDSFYKEFFKFTMPVSVISFGINFYKD